MFVFGINTGLRISDILSLKVRDVKDKSHIIIKEKKTKKNKRFPVNYTLKEEIEKYIKGMNDEDYLFPSRKGDRPITRERAFVILDQAGKEVGIDDIGTHSLRKTFGYHFYNRTKDVALLQDIFNHSAPSVTLRYIGINQDIIDKSLENFSL